MTESTSYFRTTEWGSIESGAGELRLITVKSRALRGRADLSLYLPPEAAGCRDLPVVLLLHGVYSSHWSWALRGKAHQTLQRLIDQGAIPPMILAMPSDGLWGDGSGYLKHAPGLDFEAWIVEEVPRAVQEVTGNGACSPHFIAGLSMGGFGALRLGATHPERFAAFSGHSAITVLEEMAWFVEEPLEFYQRSGSQPFSVLEAVLANRDRLRPFRFDCGREDRLIEGNRQLHRQLEAAGIGHVYEEFSGGHEWSYWEHHVESTFRFFSSLL